jgi:outer membrane lipoprotein-sorting protein
MTVLSPREESDKVILAIEKTGQPTEAFSYLAGLKKLAKLDSSRQLGFRGAKVTVQELLGMELGQYTHNSGERVMENGESLVKIEFKAKPNLNLAFPSITGYFRERDQLPARFDLFDESGQISKKMVFEEIKSVQNRQTISRVAIEDVAQKLKLKLETRKIEYDKGLSDKIFTENNLKASVTSASQRLDVGR